MKINSDKCHLFISGHKFEHLWTKIGNDQGFRKLFYGAGRRGMEEGRGGE